ncbi:DNA-processing protein DprA [Amycolatopsis sp. TRM77291]
MRPATLQHAYAYLLSSAAPPANATAIFVREVGAIEAVRQISADRAPLTVLAEQRPGDHDSAAHDAVAAAALHGHRLVTPLDDEWPTKQSRVNTFCPPLALWVNGTGRLNELAQRSVAIVGTRRPTTYGEIYAMDIAAGLSRHGINVWSGGISGIASLALRGAHNARAASVAVLGSGIRNDYPAHHETLVLGRSPDTLVVSEHNPLTISPTSHADAHYRLLVALTSACVIIEPGSSDGVMRVVEQAEIIGRPILAFPGPVNTSTFNQSHYLIRTGRATLITDAEDILKCVPALTRRERPTPDKTPES